MPLERDELDAFLAEPRLAHLATVSADGHPSIRPVWFLWADGAFWFTTRLEVRRGGRDIAAGREVAVSIASDERPYRAVLARGRPEVWKDDVPAWLERIAVRYGEPEGKSWLSRALTEPDRVAFRLVPDVLLTWDYGKGDSGRQNAGRSMRTSL
ncbi:MAG: pyridoxamine 5'-phosphate oxidase family protein [Actinomycetota bacterium]|nr:pyridoxamine 5'-phosphate oxidase family protein [Actinomycetota bacterium]